MIQIIDEYNCCGCFACAQRCPKQCITMQEDSEGFLYPKVNEASCIDCGLCEKVCPVLNQESERKPLNCYAARNPDETIRYSSSSGGVFSPIAECIIKEGGVVFGARYNEKWEVIHARANTMDEVGAFLGSKYVQSNTGTCYRETEKYLKDGRKVLFSGTPCQIAGLNKFLHMKYDNLITVEVVCHGAPSPKIWREYLEYINPDGKSISSINFRDKTHGWRRFSLAIEFGDGNSVFEPMMENIYLQGFLKNIYLRPSCHNCPARSGKSHSDLSLGDFWGVPRKVFSDDGGVSVVLVGSEKGLFLLHKIKLDLKEVSLQSVLKGNPCINHSVPAPESRKIFWNKYDQFGIKSIKLMLETMEPHGLAKIAKNMKSALKYAIRK